MKVLKYIVVLLIGLYTPFVFSQNEDSLRFVAKVNKKKIAINEVLEIEFVFNKEVDTFIPPKFENFTINQGPNQSVSIIWEKGVKVFSKTYKYSLKPKVIGEEQLIGNATIEVSGTQLQTEPMHISVTKKRSLHRANKKAKSAIKNKVFIVTEVSKNSLNELDSLTVMHRIYFPENFEMSSFSEIRKPVYKHCIIKSEHKKQFTVEQTEFRGSVYRSIVYRQAILKPEGKGEIKVKPVILDVVVDVPTGKKDIFGRYLRVPKTIRIKSNKVSVNVVK
ncbi:BatD family protein [Olleya sp. HaHaR_3_96]|uniref:BatD family protein n=1 Tax=Olleya sp. HaHaR_3_96 TaxID=2745560 RepID=UPI001C4E75C9|nr:BatD family protein [Olleya sp. HaHaR_3_96]QXP60471.1 BatD family protein [Olleya sp. HaHaR_3_96]